jgi:hypothetical protein
VRLMSRQRQSLSQLQQLLPYVLDILLNGIRPRPTLLNGVDEDGDADCRLGRRR